MLDSKSQMNSREWHARDFIQVPAGEAGEAVVAILEVEEGEVDTCREEEGVVVVGE